MSLLLDAHPMLASPSKEITADVEQAIDTLTRKGGWLFELKWDGLRCIAHVVSPGQVRLINRTGHDITGQFPEVAEQLGTLGCDVVLDGELVAYGPDGRPDFQAIAKRGKTTNARSVLRLVQSTPADFMAFDLLYRDGADLRGNSYQTRRLLLEQLVLPPQRVRLTPATDNGKLLWEFCDTHGLEGLIAKRTTSLYSAGRSGSWVKLKKTARVTCVVTGYTPGTGWAEGSVGALTLGLYDGDELVDVGRVGTGFSASDRKDLAFALDAGVQLLAEVEYANVTHDRQLRFPSFKGLRTDVDPADCTVEQLA